MGPGANDSLGGAGWRWPGFLIVVRPANATEATAEAATSHPINKAARRCEELETMRGGIGVAATVGLRRGGGRSLTVAPAAPYCSFYFLRDAAPTECQVAKRRGGREVADDERRHPTCKSRDGAEAGASECTGAAFALRQFIRNFPENRFGRHPKWAAFHRNFLHVIPGTVSAPGITHFSVTIIVCRRVFRLLSNLQMGSGTDRQMELDSSILSTAFRIVFPVDFIGSNRHALAPANRREEFP